MQTSQARRRAYTKFLIRGVTSLLKNLSYRECLSFSERFNIEDALTTMERITNNWDLSKKLQELEQDDTQTV